MKIYFAGGMPIMCRRERERELSKKFLWRRLFSFFFKELLYKSEILDIVNENLSCNDRAGK